MALPSSLFISHGAPDLLIADVPASRFLRELGRTLPRPQAVVVATAHWTTTAVAVEGGAHPGTIHDFGGFAPELYVRRYAAPGDSLLAARIVTVLAAAGIAAQVVKRGFDHGVWVPLALMFPDAAIPVVPISVQPRRDGAHHLALGAALADLHRDDVLVIGSGAMTHNLGAIAAGQDQPPAWVTEFEDWAITRIEAGDTAALADWQRQGPQARRNHPTPEHWLPLLVAMGAGGGRHGRVLHRSTTYGVLQMTVLACD